MVKVNPEVELTENRRLDDSKAGASITEDILKAVRDDETDSTREWRHQQQMWGRYYAQVNRDVNFPYPGAANIVDPLSFKHGSKLQPILMNLVVGGPRWVACRPKSERGFRSKPNIEILMEGILRGGGRHAMPDFEDQLAYGLENYCWSGKAVYESFWDFQTRLVSYTLRRDALPGRLSLLVIRPDMTRAEVAKINRIAPEQIQSMNGPAVQEWLGPYGVMQPIIPSVDWPAVAKPIRDEVVRLLGLDEEDKNDKRAADDVMAWLRSGTRERGVTIKTRKVLRDCPNVAAVSPFDIIVPDGAMNDFSQLDRITRKFFLTKNEAFAAAEDGRWSQKELDKAMEGGFGPKQATSGSTLSYDPWRQETSRRMGLLEQSDMFEFWRTHALVDIHGSRAPELVEIVWEPNSGAILRAGEYTARHGKIPFVCAPLEYNHPSFHASRGLPKVLEDAELYNTAILRHALNNAQSASCTMFTARRSQWLDPETITPMPNLVVEVEQDGDFRQVPLVSNTLPLERLGMMLQTWPEEIVGTLDIAATQNPRLFEPRTRFEVERITSSQQGVVGKRGRLFLKRIGHLYSMTFSLFQQYGPEAVYIEQTGGAPLRLTQNDVMGEVDVVPVAAVGEMDPQMRYQKALNRVAMAAQYAPFFANDPERVLDIPALVEDAFNEDDPLAAKRAVKYLPPPAVEQNVQRLQQQAAQASKYADVAARLMAGAPVGADEMQEIIKETAKLSVMKKLQPLTDSATEAHAAINRIAASQPQQGP
jgi:hypothetical protein